jgi:Flp pilus assembly protein TadG
MYLCRKEKLRRAGAAAVETAIVLLPCCIFIFAVMEYGRVIMVLQAMNNAAREGARQAAAISVSTVTPGTATSTVTATINNFLANQNLNNVTITLYEADANGNQIGSWTSAGFGQNILVKIDADFPLVFPTFGLLPNSGAAPNSMHLTVKAMMRSEAN